jgi:hypothetical protein
LTSVFVEHFESRASSRDERATRLARERADDALAGRAVWCAVPLPGGVATSRLEVVAGEPLRRVAEQLDAMLETAIEDVALGPAERAICAQATPDVAPVVRRDDVVVLHDALTALLAQPVREQGAHAVWLVRAGSPPRRPAREAWRFLRAYTFGVDAYVMGWGGSVAAVMPAAGVVTVKETLQPDLGWSSMLADVVDGDRDETVGGTLHPRPAVAAR